jgi:hypothetical protein
LQYQTTYYWRGRANLGDQYTDWSAVRSFTIPLPNMVLTTPPDTGDTTTNVPAFSWQPVQNAVSYEIQLRDSNAFPNNTTPSPITLTTTTYTPSLPLLTKTYYWRGRANLSTGQSTNWTAIQSFTISSPLNAVPVRTFYTIGAPTLTWARISWAVSYEVQVFNNAAMTGTPVFSTTVGANNLAAVVSPALTDGIYYWRMRAIGPTSASAWSSPEPFIVDVP